MTIVTALWFLSAAVLTSGTEYFSRIPSGDYFRRKDVLDCVTRFYQSEWINETEFIHEGVSGGVRAFNGEFSHMAAIGWDYNGTIVYNCGGTLIHPKFVLTAAHCSHQLNNVSPSTVRFGDTDLSTSENDKFAQQIGIKRFVRHPLHRHTRRYHDIALIELEQEVIFNAVVCPACLWLEEYLPNDSMSIVGFGEQDEGAGQSSTLQQGKVSVISNDACIEQFTLDRRLPNGLLGSQFCASHQSMDTCQGDSGGPIEVKRNDNEQNEHPLVVGVTSFGTACVNGSVGVYTKITSYIDWIEKETNETFTYEKCSGSCDTDGENVIIESNSMTSQHITIVNLLRDQTVESQLNCSGILVDDRFVLTSAFCAGNSAGVPKFIFLPFNGEKVPIAEIIVHPEYELGSSRNDIALLKLSKYLKPNSVLRPACVWSPASSDVQFIKFVTRKRGSSSLKYSSRAFALPYQICNETLQPDELCVSSRIQLIPNICTLDHGGPIFNSLYTIPLLYGLTAMKSDGCERKLYGTLIDAHTDWIKSIFWNVQREQRLVIT